MRSSTLAAAAATVLASFAFAADNSTDSGDSVQLFIDDALGGKGRYAAKIVNLCKDQTVYALQCTSASGGVVDSKTCGAAASTITVTEGPSVYKFNYVAETSTLGHNAKVSVTESCSLTGSTEANCMATIALGVDGSSTTVSTSVPVSGTDFHVYQVAITGGAEKTAGANEACKPESKPSGAAGTGPNVVGVVAVALVMGLLGVVAL